MSFFGLLCRWRCLVLCCFTSDQLDANSGDHRWNTAFRCNFFHRQGAGQQQFQSLTALRRVGLGPYRDHLTNRAQGIQHQLSRSDRHGATWINSRLNVINKLASIQGILNFELLVLGPLGLAGRNFRRFLLATSSAGRFFAQLADHLAQRQ